MTETPTNTIAVMVFDPGASTGFAMLNACGEILYTTTLTISELEDFLEFVSYMADTEVVVEQGPAFGHHSPITRRAEEYILEVFPAAHQIPPSRWKNHPVSNKRVKLSGRMATIHEHDAARLGRWFLQERNAKSTKPTGTHNASTGRERK